MKADEQSTTHGNQGGGYEDSSCALLLQEMREKRRKIPLSEDENEIWSRNLIGERRKDIVTAHTCKMRMSSF